MGDCSLLLDDASSYTNSISNLNVADAVGWWIIQIYS